VAARGRQFSRSSRKEDDQALQCAALEKLPTCEYDLIHRAIIQAIARTDSNRPEGVVNIDVLGLGTCELRALL
jgi:hypothetical protein